MLNYHTQPVNLDRLVADVVPTHGSVRKIPDLFGVEVEVEGSGQLGPLDPVWTIKEDGSLRALKPGDYCNEFIFTRPMEFAPSVKAIETLISYLTEGNRKVYDSERTSIHIHINLAADTLRTVYNLITMALIYDELFVSLHAKHREGNNFCLRAKDAAGQVMRLIQSVQGGYGFNNLHSEERYSSINFVSLLKFGTIEFRSMETHTDLRRIINWMSLIRALKAGAKSYKNPAEIIGDFSRLGPTEFVKKTMGAVQHMLLKHDFAAMLQRGVRVAQDFAYCSAWNEGEETKSGSKSLSANYKDIEDYLVQNPAPAKKKKLAGVQQYYAPPDAGVAGNYWKEFKIAQGVLNNSNIYFGGNPQPPVPPGWNGEIDG